MAIVYAFIVVGVLGALLGLGLAFASRALAVKKDERVAKLESALPGLNCGACGYAGCASYAEAIAEDEDDLTLCSPGGPEAATQLGEIMGVEVDVSAEKLVAQVHCRGGRDVSTYTFEYAGLQDCSALHLLYGGDKVCKNSCLGLGSCIRICPADAIDYDDEGKVWVDKDLCISCGKCIEICPTGVIMWIPYSADYIVACNNTDPGKVVRKHCTVGCIACKICEKRSPEGGFTVENELSTIDYAVTGDRTEAAEKCPPKCIIRVSQAVEAAQQNPTVQSIDAPPLSEASETQTSPVTDTVAVADPDGEPSQEGDEVD